MVMSGPAYALRRRLGDVREFLEVLDTHAHGIGPELGRARISGDGAA
jgi:hypothetical protein